MGNDHDQTKAADPQPGVSATQIGTDEDQLAAVIRARAMVEQACGPNEFANLVAQHPGACNDVMRYLQQTRGNGFVQQVIAFGNNSNGGGGGGPGPTPQGPAPAGPTSQPVILADMEKPKAAGVIDMAFEIDGQWVQIYASPDVDPKPNIFMFFHGWFGNYQIDPKIKDQDDDNISGSDSAHAAMAEAKAKNTIVILPQGKRASGRGSDGGAMQALRDKGFPTFLDDVLRIAGPKLGLTEKLVPNHIAMAGHSAGGYEGIHAALSTAGTYNDTITDLTLMDSNYADSHFEDAQKWALSGSPNKTVRIVQSAGQLQRTWEEVENKKTGEKKTVETTHWWFSFGDKQLEAAAKKAGMTVNHIRSFDPGAARKTWTGEDRGNNTEVVQHSQIIDGKSNVQCDVLVMWSALGHHEIRDNVMDDAIDTIGQGAKGNESFGKNQISGYGRDLTKPHSGDDLDDVKKKPDK